MVGYRDPDGNKRIGRIVGMPGDKVNITDEGRLEVNDIILSEEIFYPTDNSDTKELPYTVPQNTYYILNDHRTETDDSRIYGGVSEKDLDGTAFFLFRRRSF